MNTVSPGLLILIKGLIEVSKRARAVYADSGAKLRDTGLKSLTGRLALTHAEHVHQLRSRFLFPAKGRFLSFFDREPPYRIADTDWKDVQTALSSREQGTVLAACEAAERMTARAYTRALRRPEVSKDVRSVIEAHLRDLQSSQVFLHTIRAASNEPAPNGETFLPVSAAVA